ncbi:hypothetical protein [Pusillimonas sp. NJUB218]|uniref:hypothetical protein n=1 Tax=Pusillimonas sp. NJUB218 TaxID=2023230 RepID=UPI000F4D1527|nr:hypothetical protein [Pusillimonas sp. NJUB218]ROT46191.1 hypothetical protein CHR62_04270 [Pusillimonas sp. NJUB218]
MKKGIVVAMTAILAGCASSNNAGIGLSVLEREPYLRADRLFTKDFVQVQKAVFKHQAICNPEVKFSIDELNPNFARVTKPYTPGATDFNNTVVLHLTLNKERNSQGRVYSYYATTDNQVQDMFAIIQRPEYCPEKPELNAPESEQSAASAS